MPLNSLLLSGCLVLLTGCTLFDEPDGKPHIGIATPRQENLLPELTPAYPSLTPAYPLQNNPIADEETLNNLGSE